MQKANFINLQRPLYTNKKNDNSKKKKKPRLLGHVSCISIFEKKKNGQKALRNNSQKHTHNQ